MTLRHEVRTATCQWVDVVGPTREALLELARAHDLHPTVVEDCLDPDHLPKFERIGDATFVILRIHDDAAPEDAATIQELTRKIAIFFRPGLLLTVHRVDLHEVAALRAASDQSAATLQTLLAALAHETLRSYEKPLEGAEQMLDGFEARLFEEGTPPSLRQAHDLKRRVSLTRRILWQTSQVLHRLMPSAERSDPHHQDLLEEIEALLFWADQLLEQAALLQQVQLAMASHRTNEVMRVLTVFSAFFLPLTFIVGVYGMNFTRMPELTMRYGYLGVWILMLTVAFGIGIWFRRKGWLN